MAKKTAWCIQRSDVRLGVGGSSISGRNGGKRSKKSRIMDERSAELRLVHAPTGIIVIGFVPRGHYSRQQMVVEQKKLEEKMFLQLQDKVAEHLRIPGYLKQH